jgi:hypothetical protein
MKLNLFCCFLRRSLFVIRPARYALKLISIGFAMPMSYTNTVTAQSASQGRRVFCGSLFTFYTACGELAHGESRAGRRVDRTQSQLILNLCYSIKA